MQNETSSATANNTNTTTTTSTTTTTTTTLAPSTVASSTTPVPKNASKEAYTTDLINNRLVPADYNKNIRPNFGDNATVINMSLNINDVSSISENSMEFTVDFYVRQSWRDHRLAFEVQNNVSDIAIEGGFTEKIWLPDTFFENSKSMIAHKTVADKETTRFSIKATGDISYARKIAMTAQCSMNLLFFPVDQQRCSIKMGSFGKSVKGLTYQWRKGPEAVLFRPNIYLPTFRLVGYSKRSGSEVMFGATYSTLHLDIFIARHISFYVARIYVPSILVVIISWVPFWLDRDSHARVALGVTTVLTMTTLITNTNSELPKISHLTALDVYLFFCFLLVFLSLIEYATVGYYDMKCSREKAKRAAAAEAADENGNAIEVAATPAAVVVVEVEEKKKKGMLQLIAVSDTSIIDKFARYAFPISFLVFNVVYTLALVGIVLWNRRAQVQVKL